MGQGVTATLYLKLKRPVVQKIMKARSRKYKQLTLLRNTWVRRIEQPGEPESVEMSLKDPDEEERSQSVRSSSSQLINRDPINPSGGRTQSHTGLVSGGRQGEVICLDVPSETEPRAVDTQTTSVSTDSVGVSSGLFSHKEIPRLFSTDNAGHEVVEKHVSGHSSEGYSGRATSGVSSDLFTYTENPGVFSKDNAKVFDDSRSQERCPNSDVDDTAVSTALRCDYITDTHTYGSRTSEMHRYGTDSRPKKTTQSMKLLCRIGLSKLTLGGNEADSEVTKVLETDQPDKRKRKRVCRTSQRVSSRNLKRSKPSTTEMPDENLDNPIPTTEVVSSFHSDGSSSLGYITPGAESSIGCSEEPIEDELSDEVDCPMPSTAQQKEARRLARLRQLKEMRARETMEARRERALKRRGEQSPSKQRPSSSAKRVSWKEDGSLTRVMEYDFMS